MRGTRRKVVTVAGGALIRCEIDRDAAPFERLGQGLRGKQVPAGAAAGEQHKRLACHQAVRNSGGSRS